VRGAVVHRGQIGWSGDSNAGDDGGQGAGGRFVSRMHTLGQAAGQLAQIVAGCDGTMCGLLERVALQMVHRVLLRGTYRSG
jgi:hypothetical protein